MDIQLQKAIRQCQLGGACDKLTSEMTLEELCTLSHTPQGREFILKGIPTLETYRLFKGYHLEQYGIFLDSGKVTIDPPTTKSIIAIGDTSITYNASGLALYCVTLLHGAKASITASDWAVVKVESDPHSTYTATTREHAILL